MIGIDSQNRLAYEGEGIIGRSLWPTEPFFSAATIVKTDGDYSAVPNVVDLAMVPLLFREDFYDPVTRVRRGRFYVRDSGSQPRNWLLHPNPALNDSRYIGREGLINRQLFTFQDWPARSHVGITAATGIVALGVQSAMTLWRVIGIEQISTREDLVTLKSRSNLGVLPELNAEEIPETGRKLVLEAAERVVDTAYRSGPESVVDRCRELATAALSCLFEISGEDLGYLAAEAERRKRFLLQSCSRTLALLHSRTKVAEQQARGLAHPSEEDAQLSLQCIGSILRETGWVIG